MKKKEKNKIEKHFASLEKFFEKKVFLCIYTRFSFTIFILIVRKTGAKSERGFGLQKKEERKGVWPDKVFFS